MSLYNKPSPLEINDAVGENLRKFRQEVDIYFIATEAYEKPVKVQVARLLNLLGPEALKVYNTFDKEEGVEETVESVLNKFDQFVKPKINETMTHYNFFKRKQLENEQFDHFLTDLRHLVDLCDFGDLRDKMLRTQLVLGLRDSDLQSRLLREDMTLKKVINYCQAVESADRHSKVLEKESTVAVSCSKITEIKYNQHVNREQPRQQNSQRKFSCRKCGRSHSIRECPAYGKICLKCNEKNHFANVCRTNHQNQFGRKGKPVNEIVYDLDTVTILDVNQAEWFETIYLNKIPVKFKVDTGAGVNVLSEDVYQREFSNIPLEKSNLRLEAFGGFVVQPLGMFKGVFEFRGVHTSANVYVVKCSKSLLGFQSITELEVMEKIRNVDVQVQSYDDDKDVFLEKHKDVFQGIGQFPDLCSLKLKDGAVPRAQPSRRVPMKIKNKLRETLSQYVKEGIISESEEPRLQQVHSTKSYKEPEIQC
ncbi:hypothetical protein M8J77_007265 [Diaphorina citri]|nr:hypothetical protein M8J77_007265 [Diaphorina citri]